NDVLYDASPPDISNLSLHDALPIFLHVTSAPTRGQEAVVQDADLPLVLRIDEGPPACDILLEEIVAIANRVTIEELRHELELLRSEEHTSELQSRFDLVCRLLLEKK